MPTIKYNNCFIPYQVSRSKRARLLRLEWRAGKAQCVAPIKASNAEILQFIFQHTGWMAKQLRKEDRLASHGAVSWPGTMSAGTTVPFLGVKLILAESDCAQIWRQGKFLYYPEGLQTKQIEKMVIDWLKLQSIKYAKHWSKKITRNFGLKPNSINIRSQKSRWGSCGIHDDIYLNWRLMCCPRRAFMYVVVHEHCHLVHRNHGKQFWALVGKMMLDYKQHDKWLNQYGSFIGN